MKSLKLLVALITITTLSCSPDSEDTNYDFDMTITATGLSDNKLAQNNVASFVAQVSGNDDNVPLGYRWTLVTERAEFYDGFNTFTNPYDGGTGISARGLTPGEEQIKVEARDADGVIRAATTLDFEVIPANGNTEFPRGCYDQPKIYYQRGAGSYYTINLDGTGIEPTGFGGGISIAISPDGEWVGFNPYQVEDNPPVGYAMYAARCDGSELVRIPTDAVGFETDATDYLPEFSHDSKTLYFLRSNALQDFPVNSSGYSDIVAYSVETGEVNYLTSLYQNDESVEQFTVSPITGDIAFIKRAYQGTSVTTQFVVMQPETGAIISTRTIPNASFNGMDWSPDGNNVIFVAQGEMGKGIFRINLSDGSQPLPLLEDTETGTTTYVQCFYYNNGDRIVFGDYNDANNLNPYSIDANGNDLQELADISGPTFLMGVLE